MYYIYIYIYTHTSHSCGKNPEVPGFDPSQFFFQGAIFPRTKGSPRISQPGHSYYVNSYYVRALFSAQTLFRAILVRDSP